MINKRIYVEAGAQHTIDKGIKSAILFVWTNTAINSGPAVILCGRKDIQVGIPSDTLVVKGDVANYLCVIIDSDTGNIIIKNNTSALRNVGYHMFLCD